MQNARFDHEKLDVYRLQLGFLSWAASLTGEISRNVPSSPRDVLDHLSRASLSVLLNTAEGNGRRRQRMRARFFDDARGSATECAACLDALVAVGACDEARVREGKEMMARVVGMLTKLVARFSGGARVQEEEDNYAVGARGEGEDEDDRRDEDE